MVKQYASKRDALKAIANDESLPAGRAVRRAPEARQAAAHPAPQTRIRNRCEITGRPRAYYRKLKMSRIALREHGSAPEDPSASSSQAGKEGRTTMTMNDPSGRHDRP